MMLYLVKFQWYNDGADNVEKMQAIVPADSYTKAIAAIEKQFEYIEKISAKQITYNGGETPIVYLPDDKYVIDAVVGENDY